MSDPFFTVAIPTKNRPERVADAVKSVLDQTFSDLEVVVCDNSDEEDSIKTEANIRAFADPRVRYVRTNGHLSMPDNWEAAVSEARGEFVGILTDRSVFRRNALETVHTEIQSTGAKFISWFNDLYGRDESGTTFKRRPCSGKRYPLDHDVVLNYFLHGQPKFATKIVPKLMTSVCHRSILEAIRRSPAGRCCLPVAPDFTSGFLMLAHCDWLLTLDEALYISCGTGTGQAFRRRSELAEQFSRDLGLTWSEMVDQMPSDACFSHALVLNDFMRVRQLVPDRLAQFELDRTQYYLGCLNDYRKTASHGVTRDADLDALLGALEHESDEVQRQVRSTSWYRKVFSPPRDAPNGRVLRKKSKAKGDFPRFETVFEALEWDEANPRELLPESFIDIMPALAELQEAPRGDRPANGTRQSSDISKERLSSRRVAKQGPKRVKRVKRVKRSLTSRWVPKQARKRVKRRISIRRMAMQLRKWLKRRLSSIRRMAKQVRKRAKGRLRVRRMAKQLRKRVRLRTRLRQLFRRKVA